MKEYEINGVITYAHCFTIYVTASSIKEAKAIAHVKAKDRIDPAIAEHQETIIDEPILIK